MGLCANKEFLAQQIQNKSLLEIAAMAGLDERKLSLYLNCVAYQKAYEVIITDIDLLVKKMESYRQYLSEGEEGIRKIVEEMKYYADYHEALKIQMKNHRVQMDQNLKIIVSNRKAIQNHSRWAIKQIQKISDPKNSPLLDQLKNYDSLPKDVKQPFSEHKEDEINPSDFIQDQKGRPYEESIIVNFDNMNAIRDCATDSIDISKDTEEQNYKATNDNSKVSGEANLQKDGIIKAQEKKIFELQKQVSFLNQQILYFKAECIKAKRELSDEKSLNESYQQDINQYIKKIKEFEANRASNIYTINNSSSEVYTEIKRDTYTIICNLFADSKTLPLKHELDKGKHIRQKIKDVFNRNIYETNLLYSYDNINPIHHEQYIDGKENLLLLVRLPNEYVIGCFTGEFSADKQTSLDSFMFSISPDMSETIVFTAAKPVKKVNYDYNFITYGSKQFTIRSKSKICENNLNGMLSVYKAKEWINYQRFTGYQTKSFPAEMYEFYQLVFMGN